MFLRLFTLILLSFSFLTGCDWFKKDPDSETVELYLNASNRVAAHDLDDGQSLPTEIKEILEKIRPEKALESKNMQGPLKKTGGCFKDIQSLLASFTDKSLEKIKDEQLTLGTLTYHGKRESDDKFKLSKTKKCTFVKSEEVNDLAKVKKSDKNKSKKDPEKDKDKDGNK